MPCRRFIRNLESYLDGELDADAIIDLESHTQACDRCAQRLRRRIELRSRFRDALDQPAGTDLREEILLRLRLDPSGGSATSTERALGTIPEAVASRTPSSSRTGRWFERWITGGGFRPALAGVLGLLIASTAIWLTVQPPDSRTPFKRPGRVIAPRFGETADAAASREIGGLVLSASP